jgi:putative Holliday junction resolvase
MPRLLALDIGLKRVGIAMTDPEQRIASPYDTVSAFRLMEYILALMQREPIEAVVVGFPVDLLGRTTDATPAVKAFIRNFKQKFPGVPIHTIDERFTSKLAKGVILQSGKGKTARADKELVDKISAAIILQDFMERKARQ